METLVGKLMQDETVDSRTAKENTDLRARVKELEERLNAKAELTPKRKRQRGT